MHTKYLMLASQEMAEQNFGMCFLPDAKSIRHRTLARSVLKSINDAGRGMFANMLRYKAESAGCEVVLVNPKNTTQECGNCHEIVKKDLNGKGA